MYLFYRNMKQAFTEYIFTFICICNTFINETYNESYPVNTIQLITLHNET